MKKPIETAPKDGTEILACCKHDADLRIEEQQIEGKDVLTDYAAACEYMSHVEDGWHVVRCVEGYWELSSLGEKYWFPGYWCLTGDEEICANPIEWVELPSER